MTDPIRLSKRLAELTACSRREAELYIEGGWVSVDGEVIEEPQFKVLDQRVELLPGARAETIEPATLLLHKPAGWRHDDFEGLLAAGRRWSDDPRPLRALKKHFARQRPTLALDSEASGLVVFSQQHGVLRKLVDDGARLEQEYLVEVAGDLAVGGLERLRHGLAYQGRRLSPCKVSWQNESHLRFALKDVLPGQLRFMCESEGLEVRSIRRLRIGALSLARLPLGEWRYLGLHERF
ncbi:rRNA pseudouridine synthase [Pseudomonas aeruginosa]|uniref:rRNA pseudouridine synthase n=1 Tax=Pseudomonas aeruginosa TaxID=287 RepID=UPI00053ECB38|nr:rRNA pseudouridine synthase [Pseudomonas aeruginosa]EKX7272176.1 rRNA pseudouridine synthase [Pseudomonas aeruginosa]MBG4748510.1 rRNA pseudouridine synthase [Pseudomonas aeruginosa]MBH4108435.1 rRNA pseudouridine synthase [Pseudomonas aeruginosa]MBI7465694.1 rRNA pseudouridine synthase [Pseudomonas aeruginosa]MBX5599479.1 rRNA pseudouridine synthase [Pseudomonas aeruginosa]